MADYKSTGFTGSAEGTRETDSKATNAGSGQVDSAGKPITRDMTGSGKSDKWSKGQEEIMQDQPATRPDNFSQSGKSDIGGGASSDASGSSSQSGKSGTQALTETVSDVAHQAKSTAINVANEAQSALSGVTDQVKHDANTIVAEQKDMFASRLRTFSDTLRETGNKMQSEDEQKVSQYAQGAATQIDRFAGFLQGHDAGDIVNEVRNYAQRQPEVFVAGSLAVGFLLGRFLKASGMLPGGYGGHNGSRQVQPSGYQAGYGQAGNYGSGYAGRYARGNQGPQSGNRGSGYGSGSSYPDLQYRDAMGGDAPYREQSFRSQGDWDRTQSGYDQSGKQPDRSTTGPGYSPAEYGNTAYRGASSEAAGETGSASKDVVSGGKGYDDQSKSGEMNKQDPGSVRGSQTS